MRIWISAFSVMVAGCTQHPTENESKLAAYVEQHVVLPNGSPGPQCYERYYRIIDGAELTELAPSLGDNGQRLLIGQYFPVREPQSDTRTGIVWVNSEEEVPSLFDGGCGQIGVWYLLGGPPENIEAMCSFTVGGAIPEEVEPFSCYSGCSKIPASHPTHDISDHPSGTPGSSLLVRIVSEVLTLATLGAGVSLLVRNSWKL